MDFSTFDTRSTAEAGTPMQIKDAFTGEPIMDGDKPCRVLVRGVASKTAQAEMRERQRAAMTAEPETDADDTRVMEDAHNDLCGAAAPFIIGFENVDRGDRPCEATPDDIEWFLDLTFPEMGPKTEDGKPVFEDDFDEGGKPIRRPVYELKNNPFAKQVSDHASSMRELLGNDSAA